MKEYKLAVVGATGLVGRNVIEVLEEYNLPISNIEFFASRRSAGTEFFFKGKQRLVHELKETSFDEGFDFAIFSAGSDISKKFAPIAASKGCIVVDNSSAFRMDPEVPLVVPEVNPEKIFEDNGDTTNEYLVHAASMETSSDAPYCSYKFLEIAFKIFKVSSKSIKITPF